MIWRQRADRVFVREPGFRRYNLDISVTEHAKLIHEYAVLATTSYHSEFQGNACKFGDCSCSGDLNTAPVKHKTVPTCASLTATVTNADLQGWTRFDNFPSDKLRCTSIAEGLFVEAWYHNASGRLAVVFAGTHFTSWKDWLSNAHWLTRYFPYQVSADQYSIVRFELAREFQEYFSRPEIPAIKGLISIGHSLGGGLAQHFAYSLPHRASGRVPYVTEVYAFNPSPVTGWFSVESAVRGENAQHIRTQRIFEHGEVLAYLRLMMGYLHPPSSNPPLISQYRYNLSNSWDMIFSHSMESLASELLKHTRQAQLAENSTKARIP